MKVSIVIVTYNSEATIYNCLSSVFSSSLKSEVIVVDNNSTDNTVEVINKFPNVKLIQNKKNFGFGKANNLGVKASNGNYIFFLNPDCVVEKDSVEKLAGFLEKNSETAVVGPKLINQDESIQREISPFPTVLSEILVLLRLHRIGLFKKSVYSDYDYGKTQSTEHLMGAALMVKRNVFEKLDGFDEKFFLWFEETDLLKRVSENGQKIVYYPESIVKHLVGQSTRQIDPLTKQTIWNKSLIYYFQKHKGWFKLLLLIPFIILSYPAALVSYLIKN